MQRNFQQPNAPKVQPQPKVRPQSGTVPEEQGHFSRVDLQLAPYGFRTAPWNPNTGYAFSADDAAVRDNLYTLLFPFQNIGDQLDSEIMPLRVQWAAQEQKSELDPNSESWAKFKKLYGFQFGEQKTIGLFAPELSFQGSGEATTERFDFGRYLRVVYLYVKPAARHEFEDFVHKFIVPSAEEILRKRDEITNAPPPEARTYWRLPKYLRKVSINVNMPTIPEFELFIQQQLLTAARDTDIPVLTYRTVTGNKHNYHLLFPSNDSTDIHHSRDNLMASSLLREHQIQLAAKRTRKGKTLVNTSYRLDPGMEAEAIGIADELAAEFHSHAIEIEEIVYRTRPDMSALLQGRYSQESVKEVWDHFRRSAATT